MAPTKELSVETMKRIVNLIQEGNTQWIFTEDIGCSPLTVSKMWNKFERNGEVKKGGKYL